MKAESRYADWLHDKLWFPRGEFLEWKQLVVITCWISQINDTMRIPHRLRLVSRRQLADDSFGECNQIDENGGSVIWVSLVEAAVCWMTVYPREFPIKRS